MKIAIEGMIGCGKSTLVDNLKQQLTNAVTYQEDIDAELLAAFYNGFEGSDQTKLEMLNQFHFLLSNIKREIKSDLLDRNVDVIYDRTITAHIHIFGKEVLDDASYVTYNGFQEIFLNLLGFSKYDLTILIRADFEAVLERISNRGRECEQGSEHTDYYRNLQIKYNEKFFLEQLKRHSKHVIVLDTTHLTEEETLANVMELISAHRKLV